jgi:hypothetical protein
MQEISVELLLFKRVESYWLVKEWIANCCLSLSRWENHPII